MMTGRYKIVWTLKEGVVNPRRLVDHDTQKILERSATMDHLSQHPTIARDVFWQERSA